MKKTRSYKKRRELLITYILLGALLLSAQPAAFIKAAETSTEEISTEEITTEEISDSTEETAEPEETNNWIQPGKHDKYCCMEVGHVIYCYFLEDCTVLPSLPYIMGIKTSTSSSVANNPLPCENRSQLRAAGSNGEAGEYHAGEITAIGINLTGVKNHETIRVADSLEYNGETVPVTSLRLQQFLYSYPGSDHVEEEFNKLTDTVSIHIGKYVRSVLLGDTAAVAESYSVDEGNPLLRSADGILYRVEGTDCYPLGIPDRYQKTTVKLAEGCNTFREEYLENTFKYEALYPLEYAMGTLAGDFFSGQYIHYPTIEWKEGLSLEDYLKRNGSVYIPLEITDEAHTHSNILVLYGDGESRRMYDEIEGNHEIFLANAFYAKGYQPSEISVDRMSYRELTAYSMLKDYDFIFIEDDTYNYFGEVQYSILKSASYDEIHVTYAAGLEELDYPDIEKPLSYESVTELCLPDSLELDSALYLLTRQAELFPRLVSLNGTDTASFYKKDGQDVLYAEDEDGVYCLGVTNNNQYSDFHLKTEKQLYVMPYAFQRIKKADIYLHAPVLYLGYNCFADYSLGTDDTDSPQEIFAEYDTNVYEEYYFTGDKAEFPTAGTEEEMYRYVAEFILCENPDDPDTTEEPATEPTTEPATEPEGEDPETEPEPSAAPVKAVQSVPLSGTALTKKPNYYLNNNNQGTIYLYSLYGKVVHTNALNETLFSTTDEKNADALLKKILDVDAKKEKVFITATDSTYEEKKCKKLGYVILASGLSSGELKRALTVLNCKYFQYLLITQSYKKNGKYVYIDTEEGLEVFHKKDEEGKFQQCNIAFGLKVSDWEITDTNKAFTGWVYGIQYKKFKEYYDICDASEKEINRIINIYTMKEANSAENLITKINHYVRTRMAYDNYKEINDLSWALKNTSRERNDSHDNVDRHGMCAAYSRLAFAIGARFGYEIIPCHVWENEAAKTQKKGSTHSVSKVIINGYTRYCDFCWSSITYKGDEQKYIYMDDKKMKETADHFGPEEYEMGTIISFRGKEIKDDILNVFTVTFDGNGGKANKEKKLTNYEGKLTSLPSAARRDYLFKGWYTAKNLGKKITLETVFEKDTKVYAHWEKAQPKKVKITKGKQKNTSLVISYKKLSNVDGYQLRYSTMKTFTASTSNVINNKNGKSTTITIPDLKKNHTYYVKVRAFRKDSAGKTVYGPWSTVKKYKLK